MSSEEQKWAVLIGIDNYSSVKQSLDGCVRDVEDIREILKHNHGIPDERTWALIAPLQSTDQDTKSPTWPTRKNVLSVLEEVGNKASEGDFVYIHFSGHGDRVPSRYDEKIGVTQLDEVICTLEQDIRDVELGDELDKLAHKGLVVLVVLDCCFSGGATRHRLQDNTGINTNLQRWKVRRRPANNPEPEDGIESERGKEHQKQVSSTRTRDNWFNRKRDYNLLAACQPHEFAGEARVLDGNGSEKYRGALTHFLIESLQALGQAMAATTYETLQSALNAKFRDFDLDQHPMHLGYPNRVIFSSTDLPPDYSVMTANVIKIKPASEKQEPFLFLDRGTVDGVAQGDVYSIYKPEDSFTTNGQPLFQVAISQVEDRQSEARLKDDGGVWQDVSPGWPAKLVSRGAAAIAKVVTTAGQHHDIIKELKRTWQCYDRFSSRVNLQFDDWTGEAAFHVSISDDLCYCVEDSQRSRMPHVPGIKIDEPNATEQLMQLLAHLRSYEMVLNLKHPPTDTLPDYHLKISKVEPLEGRLNARRIAFTNNHTKALYVTVLNLTAAYGVEQVHPSHFGASSAIDPGASLERVIIDITVPSLLESEASSPDFTMRDVFKVIVTTEPAVFSHYRLPDLNNRKPRKWRNAVLRVPLDGKWFVVEEEIISHSRQMVPEVPVRRGRRLRRG